MNILIICGETSSNLYGAKLARALIKNHHQVYSFGDHHLAKASEQLLSIDATHHSVNVGQWRSKHQLIRNIQQSLDNGHVSFDRAILIDFPGYNFKIATVLKQHGISIVTFITPNFWLWKDHSLAKKLMSYSDHVIAIFQKEFAFYSSIEPNKTSYFGHPLLLEDINAKGYDPSSKTIALFPGSRNTEIEDHLPVMLRIASQFPTEFSFNVICDNERLHPLIRDHFIRLNIDSITIASSIEAPVGYAITAPGTNTLRLALMGIPMTIIGALNFWVYLMAKYGLRIKLDFIGLPNVILNQMVYPEYIRPKSHQIQQIALDISAFFESDELKLKNESFHQSLLSKLSIENDYYQTLSALISRAF